MPQLCSRLTPSSVLIESLLVGHRGPCVVLAIDYIQDTSMLTILTLQPQGWNIFIQYMQMKLFASPCWLSAQDRKYAPPVISLWIISDFVP